MSEQPQSLHRAIEAAQLLRRQIAALVVADKVEAGELSAEDAATIQDTFDGETTLEIELEKALVAEDDDKILVAGISQRMDELAGRRDRLKKRIEARRGLIEQAMTIAEWPKHETPLGTISLGKSPPKVEIDDESQIPSQFFKRADPTLDKAGLGRTLKERHKAIEAIEKTIKNPAEREAALKKLDAEMPPIPGVRLVTDGKQLTIRRK